MNNGKARKIFLHYGAVALTALAVAIRWLLDPWLGDHLPLVTIYGAITAAGFYGGFQSALSSVLLGYLGCDYLFIEPRNAIDLPNHPRQWIGLVLYLGTCAVIIVAVEALRRATVKAQGSEEELRRTNEHLRIITDTMAAPVTRCSSDLRYVWVSKPYTDWLNRPASEIVGRPILDVIGKAAFERLYPRFHEVLSGQVVRYEEQIEFAKIGPRWITAVYTPTRGRDGVPDGWVALVNDVTERRRTEDRLRQSEERLRLALHAGRLGYFEVDLFTKAVSSDRAHRAIWGLDPGAPLTVDDVFKLIHPDDVERVKREEQAALLSGHQETEFRIVRIDGEVRWLAEHTNVVRGADGKALQMIGLNVDITERKRQEEALNSSGQRLTEELDVITRLHALSTRLLAERNVQAAFDDLLANAILSCGADFGNLQFYNPQIKALEIIAQRGFRQDFLDYFRIVRVDDGSACARAMQNGEHCIIEDVQADLAFEPHRSIAAAADFRGVHSTPLKDRDDSVIGVLSVHFRQRHRSSERQRRLLDLYARYAVNLIERNRFEEAMKEADRRKDEFLAILAHELRNPLAPLRNGLQIIRLAENDRTVVKQARAMMERQLEHFVRLVDDLLDLSRISRGKIVLQRERIDLATVMDSAVETCRPLVNQSDHELTVTLPDDPVYVDIDKIRLAQVLVNLLTNAAKFSERGSRIWLTAERQGSDAVVSVRDTGVGIPPHMLSKVFEMFSQVDRSLEKTQGGLGIGLSVVKRLVEMHGGSVEARSEGNGMGSEFLIRLPVVLSLVHGRVEGGAGDQQQPLPIACYRVLVVDDNPDSANSLAMMLKLMGQEVRTAHDGLEGVATAAAYRPDLILLDIGMPKMNGYDACRRIREQPWGKGVLIAAVTGWGQDEERSRSQEAGIDRHLIKPVGLAELEKLLIELRARTA